MDDTAHVTEATYRAAAEAIRDRTRQQPTIGLILGSGLGTLVNEISNADMISYDQIPEWPRATVLGHAGKLVIGMLENQTVLAMQGRAHFYEWYSMQQITLPVRVMKLLGIDTLIVTNAAGGLNPDFRAGDIMVIEDHIFPPGMAGYNPLRGPNLPAFGPRFAAYTRAYNPTLRKLAHKVAQENNIPLQEGVYVSLSGPTFETPAEVRMLRTLGGDTVGMSTAPEVLVAYHTGMRVLGFSTVTNASLDSTEAEADVSHEEVLRLGQETVPKLATILRGVLRQLPPYNPDEMENHPEA